MSSYAIDKFIESFFCESTTGVPVEERATETTESFGIELELAGVRKEDITLDIDGDYLTVSAIKKAPSDDGAKVLFGSRTSGKFEKSYKLGSNIDRDAIDAEYTDGVLVITLNKKEDTKKKKTVKIS
jgi:HSP20 family protein